METQTLIAYILNHMNGTIRGRVQLQKLIYFCKAFGTTVNANYKLYIYGPYSQQVADSLHEGVMDDIFSETKGLISKGTEFDKYFHNLNKEDCLTNPQRIHDILNTFKDLDINHLEILATTFFIYRQQKSLFGDVDKDNVLDKVRRAKSCRFTEEQIVNSYNKMEEICLPLAEKYS